MNHLILSIDTSCDDTSAAVVCGREIWSNVIASQTDLHRPYGGVFPTVAKQAHKENIAPTVNTALKRAGVSINQIEKIAVTIGPGLAPALEVGIEFAKYLAEQHGLPLVPVNHIEGHVLSVLATPRKKPSTSRTVSLGAKKAVNLPALPALSIIVSGGHTQFILVESLQARPAGPTNDSEATLNRQRCPELISEHSQSPVGKQYQKPSTSRTVSLGAKKAVRQLEAIPLLPSQPALDRYPRLSLTPDHRDPERPHYHSGQFYYTILGQTLDDAAGECLDKVGRMLNLGYPAAPVMEQLAKLGDPSQYSFPLPMTTTHDYHLSFAGLKTHARRLIESAWKDQPPTKQQTYDFCASLQRAVFRHITYKLSKVLEDYPQIQEVWLGGGVAANMELRKMIRQTIKKCARHAELVSTSQKESLGAQIANNRSTLTFRVPYTKRLCQDNAGMIGVATQPIN